MPTILDRTNLIMAGLERAKQANIARQESAELSRRRAEWSEHKAHQLRLKDRHSWIPLSPAATASVAAENTKVRPLALEAAKRLQEEGVQGLTKDDLWMRLGASAASAVKVTEEALRSAWQLQVEAIGDFEEPTSIERKVKSAPSPGNLAAFEDYKRAHFNYRSVVKQPLPSDPSALSVLNEAAATLRKVRERFDFSMPLEVKHFLEALEYGGAALGLLTPAVLDWLKQNDDINRFVIRVKATR